MYSPPSLDSKLRPFRKFLTDSESDANPSSNPNPALSKLKNISPKKLHSKIDFRPLMAISKNSPLKFTQIQNASPPSIFLGSSGEKVENSRIMNLRRIYLF